jgi:hypothetical protein
VDLECIVLEQQAKPCLRFRSLNPSGYVEFQDVCFPTNCFEPEKAKESIGVELITNMAEAGHQIGLDFQAPEKWVGMLEANGFVDIHVKWVHWPIGPWAKGEKFKIMGKLTLEDFLGAVDTTVPIFKAIGWSAEKAQTLINAAIDEYKDQKILCIKEYAFAMQESLEVCSF